MRITRIRDEDHWRYEVCLAGDASSAELQAFGLLIRQLRAEAWPFLVGGSRQAPQVALFVGPLASTQALAFERAWGEHLT
jgi:hypothetical protein